MPSYLEASGFARPRTEFAVTDNRYVCALVDGPRPDKRPPKPPAPPKWDAVLAMALRQPRARRATRSDLRHVREAARRLVLRERRLAVCDAGQHQRLLRGRRRARLPEALCRAHSARLQRGARRPSSLPSCSPSAPVPPPGSFDEMLREADIYSDGFARAGAHLSARPRGLPEPVATERPAAAPV